MPQRWVGGPGERAAAGAGRPHQVAYCANRGAVVGCWFGVLAGVWDAVDGSDAAGADDLDLFDELLDQGFALSRGPAVEDLVDVFGQGVEIVPFLSRRAWLGLVEQFGEFVAARL